MNNITFDLETLGRSSRAPIVQLAAVHFSDTGEQFSVFDARIHYDQMWPLFESDFSTISWWLNQSEEVKKSVFNPQGTIGLGSALAMFSLWVNEISGKKKFWSHATFDPPILMNAYAQTGIPAPIHYREFLDIRTLNHLSKQEILIPPRDTFGPQHDAVSDCMYQAVYISALLKNLKQEK